MIGRCYNSRFPSYKNYGGRGIGVCDRWRPAMGGSFANFLQDMGVRPPGKTIDRVDNDGNYIPENCKWSTPTEQNRDQRGRRAA